MPTIHKTEVKKRGVSNLMKIFKKIRKLTIGAISASLLLGLSFMPIQGLANTGRVYANEDSSKVDLWRSVNPLNTTVSFMNTGAHPDDERSDFLAYLSLGLGVETTSIIANRGEGGQNQIGRELYNPLGIVRSNEMIEATKITNVSTYHLSEKIDDPIYDFGFSKTPEETLEIWGEELTHERLIHQIRSLKPDIVMPAFRDVPTQHGHHRAMTILTERAFADAADPNVYPEHLEEGLETWQIKKLYLPAESEDTATTKIDISAKDEIYGMTYPQLGEKSRYLHKSQGMGREIPDDQEVIVHLDLERNATDATEKEDIFEGIPYDFAEWADIVTNDYPEIADEFKSLQTKLDEVVEAYPSESDLFNRSQEALEETRSLHERVKNTISGDYLSTILNKLSVKIEQLEEVNYLSSQLTVESSIDSAILVQGQKASVTVKLVNNGQHTIEKLTLELDSPADWTIDEETFLVDLAAGATKEVKINLTVPTDATYFDPYKEAVISLKVNYGDEKRTVERMEYLDETIAVLPDVSLTLNPENVVVNTANVQEEIEINVIAKNYAGENTKAIVSLDLPENWTVENDEQKISFTEKLEEKELSFKVKPAEDVEDGNVDIQAVAEVNGKELKNTVQEISYDHIKDSYYIYPSKVNGVAFELLSEKNLKVGYVDSGMDEIAENLKNIGLDITLLEESDLATADLSQYDTIVTGIRAYRSREDLIKHNDRLLDYVKKGGHLVTQHNLPGEWNDNNFSPYPITAGSPSIKWRVTDQNAKVTVIQPDASLFNYPNKIKDSDWDNWVQERAIYFPSDWADEYETFISMKDEGDTEPYTSGILKAEYGEGTHIYTNLVWYRQIQNQVPGGYRIFTNLITPSKDKELEDSRGWVKKDSDWYYYDSKGDLQTGWTKVKETWYYMDADGVMQTGWIKLDSKWYYLNASGAMQKGWTQITTGGKWYYMNASGIMQTGWQKVKDTWYYMNNRGDMATGWMQLNGSWYYLNASGRMQTGWTQTRTGGKWYYLNASGVMQKGWQKVNGSWFYMNDNGAMETGWVKLNGNWYYLNANGRMQTGWTQTRIGGKWYYMNDSGVMQTGWLRLNGTWYYLNKDGSMEE